MVKQASSDIKQKGEGGARTDGDILKSQRSSHFYSLGTRTFDEGRNIEIKRMIQENCISDR